ncbi:MAG: hypothetical protein E7266_04550 [Lachnospiraceae bacterium]|nr:hypothetical protein [Lachnospiraceae bacterium]
MRKIKIVITILSALLIFNIANIIAFAATNAAGDNYKICAALPMYKNYTYYKTSSTPSIDTAIQNAMNTWNNASLQANSGNRINFFSLASGTKTCDINDSYNTIGSLVSYYDIISAGGTATAIALNSRFTYNSGYIFFSDIMFNSNYSFGNGMSMQYYDYQGILTHELGHTLGLDDLYENSIELDVDTVNDLPVMYGSDTYGNASVNVTVLLRYIKQGDIDGLAEVIDRRGF